MPPSPYAGMGYTHAAGSSAPPAGGWVAPSGTNSEWWREDIIVMVDAADPHMAAAGEGHKIKPGPAGIVAGKVNEKLRGGALKTGKSITRKLAELLKIYAAVEYLMGLNGTASGLGWHEVYGANIVTREQEIVWKGIVAKKPACKPFRNKSWDLYECVGKLKPCKAKGDYVIRAASGSVGANRAPSPAPAAPMDDDDYAPGLDEQGDDDPSPDGPAAGQTTSREGTPAPATPAPVSRKRSATSAASSTPGPAKRGRVADGLAAISVTFSEFTTAYKESAAMFASVLQPPDHSKAALRLMTEKDRDWLKKHRKYREATQLLKKEDDARHYLNMGELGSSPRRDTLRGELDISETEDEYE